MTTETSNTTTTTTTETPTVPTVDDGTKKKKKHGKSRTSRAGLTFSVGRVESAMRRGTYSKRVSTVAPVYLAGVVQQAVEDLVDGAVENMKADKRSRVKCSDIQKAIATTKNLRELADDAEVIDGGACFSVDGELDEDANSSGDDQRRGDGVGASGPVIMHAQISNRSLRKSGEGSEASSTTADKGTNKNKKTAPKKKAGATTTRTPPRKRAKKIAEQPPKETAPPNTTEPSNA